MKPISSLLFIAITALIETMVVGAPVAKKTWKPAPPRAVAALVAEPAACKTLMADYENVSKSLALTKAQGAIDDSAARATMREAEDNNALTKARMAFDIMKSNGCKLPTFTPSASRYGGASLTCATDLQKNRSAEALDEYLRRVVDHPTPTSCDVDRWKPDE